MMVEQLYTIAHTSKKTAALFAKMVALEKEIFYLLRASKQGKYVDENDFSDISKETYDVTAAFLAACTK